MRWIIGLLLAVAGSFWLSGCSSSTRPNWGDHAYYHALVAISQYQQSLKVVVTRISIPGATYQHIELRVAKPLELAVSRLSGIKSVKSQSSDGGFLMEVQFNQPADTTQLAEVRGIVDSFWQERAMAGEAPTVSLEEASIL